MAVNADITAALFQDGTLVVDQTPPVAVGGWQLRFLVQKRFGQDASGLITKTCASGYGNGASGITILNSGEGRIQVDIWSRETSGWQAGNYAYLVERLDSGSRTQLTAGTLIMKPNGAM